MGDASRAHHRHQATFARAIVHRRHCLDARSMFERCARSHRVANQPMTDSLVFDRFMVRATLQNAVCGKFFWVGRKRHSASVCSGGELWMTQTFLLRANDISNFHRARKRRFHKGFCDVCRFRRARWMICALALRAMCIARRHAGGIERRPRARTLAVNRSRCFFYRSGVIQMQ